ncbi:MAG: hypothetical protein HYR49_08780 [Gammaproteobacteria bacterium]|nr:hypothetical protein [Gammaproteobacteria bacterium]
MSRAALPLVLAALLAPSAAAEPLTGTGKGSLAFAQGRARYEAGDFELAVTILEQAVALEPGVSDYHLWLARSYGRSAEQSNWLRAMRLARRTLREFQIAVALNPGNRPAWSDLAEYYRRAPGILGGSAKKAGEIEARLAASTATAPP